MRAMCVSSSEPSQCSSSKHVVVSVALLFQLMWNWFSAICDDFVLTFWRCFNYHYSLASWALPMSEPLKSEQYLFWKYFMILSNCERYSDLTPQLTKPKRGQVTWAVCVCRFQGLAVALIYCFFNSEVRASIKTHYRRWNMERSMIEFSGINHRQE